jgi:hypothetical protein
LSTTYDDLSSIFGLFTSMPSNSKSPSAIWRTSRPMPRNLTLDLSYLLTTALRFLPSRR